MRDLRALARGVMCVGFDGDTPQRAPLDALRAFGPAGVVLFARNVGTPDELRALTAALRSGGDAPFLAVDQEGGRVERIRNGAVTALPAPMAVAAARDPAACERLGMLLGGELAALGFGVNFAPCADLALEPRNTVIGNRSYGDDGETVARFASAFARGLECGGIAATLKHFPGHGATAVDSHEALPRVDAPAATLHARDVVPFARGIAQDAASLVMTAHVVAAALDPDAPASLSPAAVRLLRDELGFRGVIATDCLEMGAVAATADAAPRALAAGTDLLVFSRDLDAASRAADRIAAAVEDGRLPFARLEDAAHRVRALRAPRAGTAHAGDAALARGVAQRAVTVLRGDVRLRRGAPVTVVSFEGDLSDGAAASAGARPSLSAALRAHGWKSELMRVPLAPSNDDVDLLLDELATLGDRNLVAVMRRAHLFPAQAAAVARILAAFPQTLLISAREPYDAALFADAPRLACIYGDEQVSFDGCADVLDGRAQPGGRLPVRIDRATAVR